MGRADDSFLKRQIFMESIGVLVLEDGKEGPYYGDRVRKVALRSREGLGSGSRLKEEESEVDEDSRPSASMCVWEDNEHGCPAVVEGAEEMNSVHLVPMYVLVCGISAGAILLTLHSV